MSNWKAERTLRGAHVVRDVKINRNVCVIDWRNPNGRAIAYGISALPDLVFTLKWLNENAKLTTSERGMISRALKQALEGEDGNKI
jgi:hypothetical protein